MDSIPDFLPPVVLTLLLPYWSKLLDWLNLQVYDQLVLRHNREHLLVRLQGQLDVQPLVRACAAYRHGAGRGAPVRHALPLLVRALVVKYLYHWSLRELESQLQANLVVKWFVGSALFATVPDHTTLARFEGWVCAQQHRQFFDRVLAQIDQDFADEHAQPQLGDTFAMQADAARESLVRLLRHSCECLLRSLAKLDGAAPAQVRAQLDALALFGGAHEVHEYYLSEAERLARLQTAALAALACAQAVRHYLAASASQASAAARQRVDARLAHLDKILADELRISYSAAGQPSQASPLPAKEQGVFRLGSATDPEATFRLHGKGKQDLGYNVNLAVTTRFVREIHAVTGAQPDTVALPELVSAQHEHFGFWPAKLIYDAAAGEPKTRARVSRASAGHTQLVAALRQGRCAADRFPPSAFTLAADGVSLRCPHGQTTQRCRPDRPNSGRTFSFNSRPCQGCAGWFECRGPQAKAGAAREVFISDYRDELLAAQAYNQTAQYKHDLRLRPRVEQIIAALTRHNGARRARWRGLERADFQAKMAAMAFNLKRWLRLSRPNCPSRVQPAG